MVDRAAKGWHSEKESDIGFGICFGKYLKYWLKKEMKKTATLFVRRVYCSFDDDRITVAFSYGVLSQNEK